MEVKADPNVLRQAFRLVDDSERKVKMANYLIKTKLPLAYLIPVFEHVLRVIRDYMLLFQPYKVLNGSDGSYLPRLVNYSNRRICVLTHIG